MLLMALLLDVGVRPGEGAPEDEGVAISRSRSKGGGMLLDMDGDGAAIDEEVALDVAEPLGEAAEESL